MADDQGFHGPTEHRKNEKDRDQAFQQSHAKLGLQKPGAIGAQHDEFAMREIDDPGHAVNDGEAKGDQHQDRSDTETGQELGDDKFHLQAFKVWKTSGHGKAGRRDDTPPVCARQLLFRPSAVQTWPS